MDANKTFIEDNESNGNRTTIANREVVNIATLSTILGLTWFGNVLAIAFLMRSRVCPSQMQRFIIHLCLADIIVGFCNIMPRLIWDIRKSFTGNDILCKLMKFGMMASIYGSTYMMMMLAIDRYLSLFHSAFRYRSKSWRCRLMIVAAWIFACTFSIPQLLIFSYKRPYPGKRKTCWGTFSPSWMEKLYTLWSMSAIFFIPLIVLLYCYGRICALIWRLSKRTTTEPIEFHPSLRNRTHLHARHKTSCKVFLRQESGIVTNTWMKTMKLSLTIVICYFVCWTPFVFVQTWTAFSESFYDTATLVFLRLASLNSCTNPWIYLIFSSLWRRTPRRIDQLTALNPRNH